MRSNFILQLNHLVRILQLVFQFFSNVSDRRTYSAWTFQTGTFQAETFLDALLTFMSVSSLKKVRTLENTQGTFVTLNCLGTNRCGNRSLSRFNIERSTGIRCIWFLGQVLNFAKKFFRILSLKFISFKSINLCI